MAIDVKEDWSGPQFTRAGSSWTGARKGTVAATGAHLQTTAKGVLDAIYTANGIQQNVTYKDPAGNVLSAYMYCESVDAVVRGYGLWAWSARYSSTPEGRFPVPGSPLTEPIQYEWDFGNISEPVDYDVFGNPIQNTNGDAFATLPSNDVTVPYVICSRNEPTYNLTTAQLLANRVNNDIWTFGPPANQWRAQPGQAICKSVKPMTPITSASDYVRVRYHFEFRAPVASTIDSDGYWDSFKHREVNSGQRCFYNNGVNVVLGNIIYKKVTDGSPMQVGQDVRLASNGIPLDTNSFGVQGANGAGTTPVAAPAGTFPSNVIVESIGGIIFLKYTMHKNATFTALGL